MDFQKDYYSTLGCSPNADQAVIQAAYRALSKKYHPDVNQGSLESKEKFQEIQEAYEVLSDPTKRAYYDSMRSGTSGREYAPGEPSPDGTDYENEELQKRWGVIKEYFLNVDEVAIQLGQISPNLKLIFQLILLENRNFKQAEKIAIQIEDVYLSRYFGQNIAIKKFAKKLLQHKNLYQHADALRELNKTIAILGIEAPNDKIIENLTEKYDLYWMNVGDKPYLSKAPTADGGLPDTKEAWAVIRSLGERYGWYRQAGFLGMSFLHRHSSHQIRCFSPEEARKLMGIPLDEALRELQKRKL